MNTDLEQRLREAGSTISMNRPVEDILVGGDRLRRRRRRTALAGVGAAATVVALGASVMMSPGSSPLVTPAVASWSGGQTNLTAEELTELGDVCLEGYDIPDDTSPIVAERRDDTILAYFRHRDAHVTCEAEQDEQGTIRPGGSTFDDDVAPLPDGTHLEFLTMSTAVPVDPGPVTGLWSMHRVSKDVDRVTADVGGRTFTGTVLDGTALFWVSESFTSRQFDEAVFTAYDDQGRQLANVDHLTGNDAPQGPNDDRDQ